MGNFETTPVAERSAARVIRCTRKSVATVAFLTARFSSSPHRRLVDGEMSRSDRGARSGRRIGDTPSEGARVARTCVSSCISTARRSLRQQWPHALTLARMASCGPSGFRLTLSISGGAQRRPLHAVVRRLATQSGAPGKIASSGCSIAERMFSATFDMSF